MVLGTILLAVGIAGITSVEVTGKSITDHTVSAAKGQDCRISRVFKQGDICQPEGSVTVSSSTETVVIPRTSNDAIQNMESMFEQRRQLANAQK
jgi:Trk K+ transport system NAD-binding subunit